MRCFQISADGTVVSDQSYFYATNAQGDVIAIYDENGVKIYTYAYDAWGNLIEGREVAAGGAAAAAVNPLRYRGYYYDAETGLYYLNSRYYNPQWGRFLNADSQLSISLGVLGCNMYAYCLNNPINKVDRRGNKPGDLFDTADEAAIDFAEYINEKSINVDREYGSFIYSKTVWETKMAVCYYPRVPGNNFLSRFWNDNIAGRISKMTRIWVRVTKYSYVEPVKGTAHSVSIPANQSRTRIKVAEIHTHGAYSPGYHNDVFSSADINNYVNYLVTPLGTVRKYDPADKSDIIIYYDAPFDPKHPGRK